MSSKNRPTGVTILAALEALGGLVWLIAGAGLMMVGTVMPMVVEVPMFVGAIAGIMGAIFIIFGIIAFILAYGLFNGKSWAWLSALIFSVLGILLSAFDAISSLGAALLPIIIYLIIIYYLTRPHVKAFFGK